MNLDDKRLYLQEREKLLRLRTKELEQLLEELYDRRFNQHDISIGEYYRLASHAYNVKVRTGSSLVFHLKNFLG